MKERALRGQWNINLNLISMEQHDITVSVNDIRIFTRNDQWIRRKMRRILYFDMTEVQKKKKKKLNWEKTQKISEIS